MQCEQSIYDFEIIIYAVPITMCLFNLTSPIQMPQLFAHANAVDLAVLILV